MAIWQTNGFVSDKTVNAFWGYAYPLMTIGLAGLFDATARIELHASKNIKLWVRIVLDGSAVIGAAALHTSQHTLVKTIPAVILFACGLILCHEMWDSVKFAILLSKWAAKK